MANSFLCAKIPYACVFGYPGLDFFFLATGGRKCLNLSLLNTTMGIKNNNNVKFAR